ncbi:MAG: hypothetical protein H0T78_03105, partial [Longispora sp.]|nr:hypothetical protein [Longispora sp. (in: high G+C Gram-positive bacteria)]
MARNKVVGFTLMDGLGEELGVGLSGEVWLADGAAVAAVMDSTSSTAFFTRKKIPTPQRHSSVSAPAMMPPINAARFFFFGGMG